MSRTTLMRTSTLATSFAAALLLLAGCAAGGAVPDTGPTVPATPAGGPLDLAGVCPETVVMQQDWQPEAEHGGMYSLVGPDRTLDTDAKLVRGTLVAQGVDTGVDVEVRSGGPNVGYQTVPALMKLDDSILLGPVYSDTAIASSATSPTVAVVSQLTTSPVMFMWDPASHPDAQTLREVAASGVPVLLSDPVLAGLLQAKGLVTASQIDTGYKGTPERFVSDPRILQQGYVTSEPYSYENDITQWARPVSYEKVADYGYSVYPSALSVRADRLEQLRPCLQKLVPIMQRAQLDYLADPGPTNELIVLLAEQYQTGWTYSAGAADFAVKAMREQELVTDDPASGVFGQFDPDRMQEIVSTFGPLLQAQGALSEIPTPQSLYTNEFIDQGIRMG